MKGTRLLAATERVRRGLLDLNRELVQEGMPELHAAGKLIRPVVAFAAAQESEAAPAFWWAAGAVQLAHEASLVHDDVIDAAKERRGEATVVARSGIAAALVQGDHLLTAAYRLAARTGSLDFMDRFARSVERTVAGEREQGLRAGEWLASGEYETIVLGKSGELLGCAFAVHALLSGAADAAVRFETGRRIGLFYQMLDDLLDYCPAASTGKQPHKDWAQRRWTWPLLHVNHASFTMSIEELGRRLFESEAGPSPARRCLSEIDARADALRRDIETLLPGDAILGALLEEWRLAAHEAVAGSERLQSGVTPGPHAGAQRSPSPEFADRLAALDWRTSLPSHGRSFAFASRWFPAERRERVARVYAYCRFTDDIVDDAGSRTPAAVERDLDEWRHLSRKAYDGHATGYAFLDDVMHDAATAAVSFRYIEQLVEGVRMDLRAVHFDTLGDLQGYTYRVASVVGLWMCGLFGVHRKGVLARAASLGHAMQITNILRDVGEDLDRGRVYLPRQLMQQNGVTLEDLRAMRSGAPISAEYCSFIEELIAVADVAYDAAFLAIPELPSDTQSPIAIASYVYRGIHDAIRRNGYDNLNQRAHTTVIHKARLAAAALRRLRRVAADRPLAPTDETIVPDTRIVQSFAR